MSNWHKQGRDVLPWGSATSDPNAPPAIPDQQFRKIQTDTNGNLYVVPLSNDPGGGGLVGIPLGTLGTDQGSGNTTVLGMSNPILWTGEDANTFQAQGSHTADNMDPTPATQHGGRAALVADLGEWSLTHQPAVATRATITRAAVVNARHVCRSISASIAVDPANAPANFILNLRDGATGAGTILWSRRLAVFDLVNGGSVGVDIAGLNIVGSENTAMTLEFTAAPGGASFQTVAITGRTANAT